MIWNKSKQPADPQQDAAAAPKKGGAAAFAQKNWKWLVPVAIVVLAGGWWLLKPKGAKPANVDTSYTEAVPETRDVSNTLSGTGTLKPANTYSVKSLVPGKVLTGGFASKATTALAYILLGTFATCIATTGLADILSKKLSRLLGGHKLALIGVLTLVACLSQNLIPVHIAYIPILVPPLLGMMNRMRLDRRAVACALAFGHKAPYITIPFGFGLIFQRVIADNLSENGLSVTVKDVTAANWSIGVAMLIGLFIAVFVLYRKPRDYHDIEADTSAAEVISEKLEYRHYVMLAAAIVVAVVQVISQDLALSALCGLIIIIVFRAIKWSDIDEQIEGGIRLMGQIAIIMLVAGGYASVIKATGGIDALVNAGISAVGGSKAVAAVVITLIGLLVTMGIGTSFGTVPVLAVLFVPMCSSLGFSTPATILLISAAAALGDAGSPASDTTLGPTSGLNADGQHDHIRDTCIPTFIAFNIPIMICAILMSQVL